VSPDIIPVFGMITGIFITCGLIFGVVRVMHSPVGQALARRIQGKGVDDEDLRSEVGYLREQLEEVQRQLGETQERLDFTERMLTRGRTTPEDA
jgi:hypothetical protein